MTSSSLWNLQTTPPFRASCGRWGWSQASQSPAVYRRRCHPSASSSLMKTRTWSSRSTPIWQWTPAPVGKRFGLFHQPPSLKIIPIFLHWKKDWRFLTLKELSLALRIRSAFPEGIHYCSCITRDMSIWRDCLSAFDQEVLMFL